MIDININCVLYGVAAALPHMQKQKSGHFINIPSVFGIKVFAPGGTVYCATKAAVRTLTEGLRMETHADKIRCTIISPGAVDSELKQSTSDEASSKMVNELYNEIVIRPLHRISEPSSPSVGVVKKSVYSRRSWGTWR
jgi:NADP-dependent 3-hydroxy acid dehydrogenase YdfG